MTTGPLMSLNSPQTICSVIPGIIVGFLKQKSPLRRSTTVLYRPGKEPFYMAGLTGEIWAVASETEVIKTTVAPVIEISFSLQIDSSGIGREKLMDEAMAVCANKLLQSETALYMQINDNPGNTIITVIRRDVTCYEDFSPMYLSAQYRVLEHLSVVRGDKFDPEDAAIKITKQVTKLTPNTTVKILDTMQAPKPRKILWK